MRIVIASVMNRAQLSDSLSVVANEIRQLLGYPAVSSIHLLVARSHASLFHETIASCDPRLEIISFPVGSNLISCYCWHYRHLPCIASRLRADAVHLTFPVLLKEEAFYPGTALSLDDQRDWSIVAPGLSTAILKAWVLTRCLRVMSRLACNSASSVEPLGLVTALSAQKALNTFKIETVHHATAVDRGQLAPQNKGAYS